MNTKRSSDFKRQVDDETRKLTIVVISLSVFVAIIFGFGA